MTDEEFERLYGRPPVKPGTHKKVKIYWGRVIIAVIVFILVLCGIIQLIKAIARGISGKDSTPSVVSAADSNVVPDDPDSQLITESAAESTADSTAVQPEQKVWQFKVCIDPGHGGIDDGACITDDQGNVIRREKDDTLRLGLAVRDYLKSQGVQVIMTRETDEFIELSDICKFTNNNQADLFVSLHCDSVASDVSGFEACVHSKRPDMDTTLAMNILANLKAVGISNDRGIVYGYTNDPTQNYHVNADTVCPSVLMEMGFITSKTDNDLIDQHNTDYAKAIGDAIIQTAKDLNVVDANGTRILSEQLISRSKLYYGLDYYYNL